MNKVFLLLTILPTICLGQWIQIGNDLDGIQANEQFGISTRLNSSGQILIAAASNNNTNGGGSGQARVFEWNGTNWIQRGSSINGENSGDKFGNALSINDSGNIIAIGAPCFTNPSLPPGYAKAYQWDGTNWVQMGSTFNGTSSNNSFGTSVSLNATGLILAIAAEPFSTTSYIRVFQWDGTNWNQLGNDIIGTAVQDGFGRTISLNANGTLLAVGVTNFDSPNNNNGMLRTYEWNGTSWDQKGSDLVGDNASDFFGAGVTINDAGTIIAAGARASFNSGYVKTFEWNGTDWSQKGSTIPGINGAFFGDKNALNSAGDIIVSGTILGEYAKISKFVNTDWVELDSLSGEASSDQFGTSVSINNSGSIVSVGAFGNDAGGNQSGHVRVFDNSTILGIENINEIAQFTIYPNPTQELAYISSKNEVTSYSIISLDSKIIKTNRLYCQKKFEIDISDLSCGVYILRIQTIEKTSNLQIIKN